MDPNMEDTASHMDSRAPKINNSMLNKVVLKLFKDLYHNNEKKRSDSCVALVRYLADNISSNEDDDLSVEFKYCLKRLIRGLGGTLQKLQKANFTALVAVLHSFPNLITFDIFTKLVDCELNGQDDSTGEDGGIFTGRILAFGAAIHSGMFEKCKSDQQLKTTKSLITSAKKRSYLSVVASPFLLELVRNSSHDVFVKGVWPVLQENIAKSWADQTLDTLLLLVAGMSCHPDVIQSKDVRKWLGCRLMSSKAMPYFAEKLLVANGVVNLEHPFYDEFCNILCAADHRPMLERFWTVDVAEQISASSRNKELAVLHILALLLQKIPKQENAYILATTAVIQMLNRVLQAPHVEKERSPALHIKAKEVLSSLEKALTTADVSDELRLELLKKCLCSSKNYAGVHLVNLLENKLTLDGVKELAGQFRNVVLGAPLSDEQQPLSKDRIYAAQQLTRLTCLQICGSEVDWKVEQLTFLSEYGFFKGHSCNINLELATTLKQCFFRALDQKFSNLEVFSQVLGGIVKHLNKQLLSQSRSTLVLREPLDDKAMSSWQKMFKTVQKIEKRGMSKGNGSIEQIFYTLFLFLGLELFDDATMALEALEELQECHLRLQKNEEVQRKSGEPVWMEVTVELLLSFLSRDSHVTRTVVCAVFPHLSKHLTASSFGQILKVLDPVQSENPLSAPQELDSSSDDESEMSDSDTDTKPVNGKKSNYSVSKNENGKGEGSSSSEGESSQSEEEDNDPHEEEEQLIDKLRMELHQALGDSAALTDTESVDVDDIDEEEGERMNTALGQAFKSFSQSKPGGRKKSKEKNKTEEIVTHFRIRVLDLVELYISHEPTMALCLEAITPLLNLYAFSTKNKHRKPLENRVKNILSRLTGLKKFSSVESVDDNCLAEKIKSLTVKGIKTSNTFLSLADLVVDCCTFVVRCSIVIHSQAPFSKNLQHKSAVVEMYKAMLSEFFTKRDTLLPISLFKAVLQLNWEGCWILLKILVENAMDTNVRLFCRRQALILITVVFRNGYLLASANATRKQELMSIARRLTDHTIEWLNGEGNKAVQSRLSKQFLAELVHSLAQVLCRNEVQSLDKSALSSALSSTTCGVTKDLQKELKLLSKRCNCSERSMKASKKQKKNNNQSVNSQSNQELDSEHSYNKKANVKKNKNLMSNGLLQNEHNENPNFNNQSNVSKALLKKQRKAQNSTAMDKGLESVSFSLTNGNALSDDEHNGSHTNGHSSPFKGIPELKRKSKHSSMESDHGKKKKKK